MTTELLPPYKVMTVHRPWTVQTGGGGWFHHTLFSAAGSGPGRQWPVFSFSPGGVSVQHQWKTGAGVRDLIWPQIRLDYRLDLCVCWHQQEVETLTLTPLSVHQFTVECEWQRQVSRTLSVSVPHVLSFGELSWRNSHTHTHTHADCTVVAVAGSGAVSELGHNSSSHVYETSSPSVQGWAPVTSPSTPLVSFTLLSFNIFTRY